MSDFSSTDDHKPDGVRYITPPNVLRQKIGHGGIDALRMERAERFIETNDFDFLPYAREYLSQLERRISQSLKTPTPECRDLLSRPTMELKAGGGMFGYRLMSEIAGVLLDFLESVETLDKDALDIVSIHHKTMTVIATSNLKGPGGKEGRALAEELYAACKRYYRKHQIKKA